MASVGLRCGSTTIKYLLFFFNFVFVLAGIALVAVGALALKAKSAAGSAYTTAFIIIIAVGCIVFVVSFYGCCGAIRESTCMLTLFAIFLMTIIIVEIVGVVIIFLYGGTSLQNSIEKVFESACAGDSDDVTAVESLQEVFECCGYNGTDSSSLISYWSSCSNSTVLIGSCYASSSSSAYTDNCKTTIGDFLNLYGKIIGAVGIAIAVVEVLGVWFSLGLAGNIRDLQRARRC